MTAEIAVANKSAVALAADSAVTVSGPHGRKTYNTVNKLFTLSKIHPVGVMVFGAAEFMDIPWELIIKEYRQELGLRSFPTIHEYARDLLGYLCMSGKFITSEREKAFFDGFLFGFFSMLKSSIEAQVVTEAESGEEPSFEEIADEVLQDHIEDLRSEEDLGEFSRERARLILRNYEKSYVTIRREVFGDLPLSRKGARRLRTIAELLLHKRVFPDETSGVVVAGFGESEIFPVIVCHQLHGVIDGSLRSQEWDSTLIRHDNAAAIMPFAQHEMVVTFMEGVDPFYKRQAEREMSLSLRRALNRVVEELPGLSEEDKRKAIQRANAVRRNEVRRLENRMSMYRANEHIRPVIEAIKVLPKDELAHVAETLVNLTSFKRKVSLGVETVGGPIDVAVISRGDGFVWIKRKHYFPADLNPQFVANYFRGLRGQGGGSDAGGAALEE